jgi:hypothetical protein
VRLPARSPQAEARDHHDGAENAVDDGTGHGARGQSRWSTAAGAVLRRPVFTMKIIGAAAHPLQDRARVVDRHDALVRLTAALFVAGVLAAPAAANAQLYIEHVDTLGRDPYGSTLFFGTGLINDPVAWISPNSGDFWLNFGGIRTPSTPNPSGNPFWYWNDNLSIDTHWLHRFSVGMSLYSNNGEWGAFGQVLLLRDREFSDIVPALAIGARNIGPYDHEDRFLLGHDVTVDSTGQTHGFTPPAYTGFHTAPTLYAVATKEVMLPDEPASISSVSFTVGGGDGLFSDDGGLGTLYSSKGTVIRGVFFGVRAVAHPAPNTIVSLILENDAWDWNAGVLGTWRGLSIGIYGSEIQDGTAANPHDGFLVYNYAKLAMTFSYNGNFREIAHGQALRTDMAAFPRERRRLEREIAARDVRVHRLEAALAKLEGSEIGDVMRQRDALEKQLREEQDAIQRATEKLQQLQGAPQQ